MINISLSEIRGASFYQDFEEGKALYEKERVKILKAALNSNKYVALIEDGQKFRVTIYTDPAGRVEDFSCGCKSSHPYYNLCRHQVATLWALIFDERLQEERDRFISQRVMGELLTSFTPLERQGKKELVLKPTLILDPFEGEDVNLIETKISLQIGAERLYVVRHFKNFLESLSLGETIEFGKKFTYQPQIHSFSPGDKALLALFKELHQTVSYYRNRDNSGSPYFQPGDGLFKGKTLTLPEIHFKKFLQLAAEHLGQVDMEFMKQGKKQLTIPDVPLVTEDLPRTFYLEEEKGYLYLKEDQREPALPLTADGEYFFYKNRIHRLSREQAQNYLPFYRALANCPQEKLLISADQKDMLVSELLPRVKKSGQLVIHQKLASKIQEHPLAVEIYLDTSSGLASSSYLDNIYGLNVMDQEIDGQEQKIGEDAPINLEKNDESWERIIGRVHFCYGERIINPFAPQKANSANNHPKASAASDTSSIPATATPEGSPQEDFILIRDLEKEKKVLQVFEESGFHVNDSQIYLAGEEEIFHFVTDYLPQLQEEGQVFYSESFRTSTRRPAPTFRGQVSINENLDLLELNFELEGISSGELFEIYQALQEKKKYYRLPDGSFLPLDSPELGHMTEFLEGMELSGADFQKGQVSLPKFRSLYLDSLTGKERFSRFKKDKSFRRLIQTVREPEDTEYALPAPLTGIMRDYQVTGFKWLSTLAEHGFGGILADDMGLGKTLQAISYIQSKAGDNSLPALVLVPTSVVFNWQAEITRFAPELKTLVVTGSKGERRALVEEYLGMTNGKSPAANKKKVDVVITSYPLIRNDLDMYRDLIFSSCILDEAQYIKNAASLTAKKVKMIQAQKHFALTGTPIENSLTELWSIFDFLMPGYLPPMKKFNQRYIKGAEENALEDLARKVSPFILRRLKKDVLAELPDKIEHKMVSELTREQKKVYLAYLAQIKQELSQDIAREGFQKNRIKILAGLTRLRQICCHPALFLENYQGESGKLLQLVEVLTDLKAGGHRALLFSQFTSMLAIIRGFLDKAGYSYYYLDGSTPATERLAMVQAFNRGEDDLFLISLKAGGTGLNLTGADTVIHFDPWWNPAVEDQATDRAHRIGQEKVVNVFKFISLGTIEEKIYTLQQRKKDLINEVIRPGETFLTQLDEAEIREILEL